MSTIWKVWTPGPWLVRVHHGSGELRIGTEQSQTTIATMGIWLPDEMPEQTANAFLIAKCPTMYEYIAKKAGEGDAEAQSIITDV